MVLFILFPIRFPIIYVIVVKILVKIKTSITFVTMLSFMNKPFVKFIAGKCDKYIGKLILPKKYMCVLVLFILYKLVGFGAGVGTTGCTGCAGWAC